MTTPRIRRIVTGHGPDGRSRVESERTYARGEIDVLSPEQEPEFMLAEMWRLNPNSTTDAPDLASGKAFTFAAPAGGVAIRVCVIPNEKKRNYTKRKETYAATGTTHGFGEKIERHPAMHQTDTVDYIVIISGRLQLVLDEGEVMLAPGDVVIQRGTNHAWTNPDEEPCVIAAIMADAKPVAR